LATRHVLNILLLLAIDYPVNGTLFAFLIVSTLLLNLAIFTNC